MQSLGSVASVIAAIREEASAEVERIDEASSIEVVAVRAEGTAADVAIPNRAARLAAARAENDERSARQEWEGRRQVIEQREAWIARVVALAHERHCDVMPLVREALARIGTTECQVAVADRDRAALPKKLRATTAVIAGGCIVTAGDLVFDNSLEARARRFEAEWRQALGEVYKP